MRFKKYDKRYLPMLWIGLAIWAVGFGGSWLLETLGVEVSGQENLMGMAKELFQENHFSVLFLFCILVPFLEECSFRLWAVGKKWTIAVCLVGMALFSTGEIGLWGILAVVAMSLVPRLVKNDFRSNWIRSLISSLCFALCHISGFNGFSLGMILGLADIFGMALVMCWLVINVNFWCSVLLHALNNTLAFIAPMIFLASPVATNADGFTTELSAVRPLADNTQLVAMSTSVFDIDSSVSEFYLVGEPAELACKMFEHCVASPDVYYDWESAGDNLDGRVKYQVRLDSGALDVRKILSSYLKDIEKFQDKPLSFDTTRVMLKTVWLVFDDGHEESLDESSLEGPYGRLYRDINGKAQAFSTLVEDENGNPVFNEDSCLVWRTYILPKAHPTVLPDVMGKLQSRLDKIYGYRLEYRDDHEVTLITIK